RCRLGWSCACLSSAGLVAKDVDAGVAFGHVDHAAAVDQDVLGLVDELGRNRPAALLGVVGDEEPGDMRGGGGAGVVRWPSGTEVGEVDVPVVGRQAVQALLLVLVVRPEPAALGAEARGVVAAGQPGRGKHRYQDRVGLVGNVDGRGVGGGFVALLAQRLVV